MIEIQPVIVAHVDRSRQAFDLDDALGGAYIALDDGTLGEWGNHAAALSWGSQQACTHVLCIEDDAVPVPNLLEEAKKAVEYISNSCISLYVGTGRPRQPRVLQAIAAADAADSTWLQADSLLWGVAFIMPRWHIPHMLEWARLSVLPTDQRIGAWYRSLGMKVAYTWPSLVDHADTPSVIPGRPRPEKRVAHRVGAVPEYHGEPAMIMR